MFMQTDKTEISRPVIYRPLLLHDNVRNMGIHIVAGKGSGKSKLMGRMIGYHDFMAGKPVVFIDPQGATIDNFLDELTYLDSQEHRKIADRICYVDVSGKMDFVPALPLYYRLPTDSLMQASQRFLGIVKKLNPNLDNAAIIGWTAVERVGTNVGMVLVALGLQITEAPSLLHQTERWIPKLHELAQQNPEAKPAVDYFIYEYLPLDQVQRRMEAGTFLSKVQPFTHDARMQATFACSFQSIDWPKIVTERKAVMLDFGKEKDPLQTRFKILWLLSGLLEYVDGRGRVEPVSIIVDELAYLLALNSSGYDLLSADMDDLINRIARNDNLWLTLAHQEMFQLPEMIQKTLMTMGTQVLGVTTDEETALMYARRYHRYDPNLIKKYQPVYHQGVAIDQTPVEFTADEQDRLNSYKFTDMKTYQFWVAASPREGSVQKTLSQTDISRYVAEKHVDASTVRELKEHLVRRSSVRIDRAQAIIRKRQEQALPSVDEHSDLIPNSPASQFTPPVQRAKRKKKLSDAGLR